MEGWYLFAATDDPDLERQTAYSRAEPADAAGWHFYAAADIPVRPTGLPDGWESTLHRRVSADALEWASERVAPLTRVEFIDLFTIAEYAAIKAARASDVTVDYFFDRLQMAEYLMPTDPRTVAGLDYLVSVGLLATARRDEIVGG